jgi:hypothetical protein
VVGVVLRIEKDERHVGVRESRLQLFENSRSSWPPKV